MNERESEVRESMKRESENEGVRESKLNMDIFSNSESIMNRDTEIITQSTQNVIRMQLLKVIYIYTNTRTYILYIDIYIYIETS